MNLNYMKIETSIIHFSGGFRRMKKKSGGKFGKKMSNKSKFTTPTKNPLTR